MEMLEVRAGEEHHEEEHGADDAAEAHALEDFGNGDEHERGRGVQRFGGAPEKANTAGMIMKPASVATRVSMRPML